MTAMFMFKYFSNMLPMTFDNYFQLNNEIHSYYTRSSTKIHKPYFRTNYMKYSIKNKGNTIWNNLPETIKESKSYEHLAAEVSVYSVGVCDEYDTSPLLEGVSMKHSSVKFEYIRSSIRKCASFG